MNTLGFFFASLTAGGVSVAMIRGTSHHTTARGLEFDALRKRRNIGWIVFVSALLLLAIALLQLIFQN
jgi:hypothetical protein